MTGLVGIKLKTPVSRSAPVVFAQPFEMGAVPAGQYVAIDNPNAAVFPLRLWNDGSVKHALVMGHFDLTANVEKLFTMSTTSTAPAAGTLLTAADIATAAPTAVIDCGTFGTLSLASLLASPARTYISTSEMVECHYQGQIGSDTSLYGWFHVRKFKGENNCWVRAVVGNSSLDGPARVTKTYNMRVAIGGVDVWNVTAFKHMPMQRFDAIGWTLYDPQVEVRHDTGYLRMTKLVPNYLQAAPSQAAIDRWAAPTANMNPSGSSFVAVNDYFPGNNCNYTPYMPDTGFQEHIGVLPNWDAQYITSAAHPTLYKAVINNARAINSYGFCFVDNATKNPIKITDYPGWAGDGLGGSGNIPRTERQGSSEQFVWEGAHHGSAAKTAYDVTGDYYYLETMQFNANAAYLYETSGHGSGLNRFLNVQNRQRAWYTRSLAQVSAMYPTHMASLYQDTQSWLANLVSASWQKYCNSTLPAPWLGLEDLYNNRIDHELQPINSLSMGGEVAVEIGLFEHFFMAMSSHHAANIEALPAATMGRLSALRDYHVGVGVWPYSPQFGLDKAGDITVTLPSSQKSTGTFAAVPAAWINPSTPADIYRASTKKVFTPYPGFAQSQSSTELMVELCSDSTFDPAVINTPLVITYHKNDAGNTSGYLTGFPGTVNQYIGLSTVNTYTVGQQVPYVEGAVLGFSGMFVQMLCYGRLPADGFQYTVTKTNPPVNTGALPSTHALGGSSGGDPTGTNGYWGNGKPAHAAARDVGKAGAEAAHTNLVTATNYATTQGIAPYANTPTMGIESYVDSPPTRNFAITDSGSGETVTTPGPSLVLDSASYFGPNVLILGPYQGHGVPGSQVAGTVAGADSTTPIRDAIVAAGGTFNPLSEYRAVPSAGAHGTLVVSDADLSEIYTGDGTYDTVPMAYYEDGALISTAPQYFGTAGNGSPTVTSVTATPSAANLAGGGSVKIVTAVNGLNNPSQSGTWAKVSGVGSVIQDGTITAPAATSSQQTGLFRFISTQDGNYHVDVVLTVAVAGQAVDTTRPVMVGPITPSAVTSGGFTVSVPAATDNVAIKEYKWRINGGAPVSTGLTRTKSYSGLAEQTTYSIQVLAYDTSDNPALTPLTIDVTTSAAQTGPVLTDKTLLVTLKDAGLALRPNVANINWTWSDTRGEITSFGSGLATNALGQVMVPIKTALLSDGVGKLTMDNYDGGNILTYSATTVWLRVP